MFDLDNRQIATLIWSGLVVVGLMAWPKVRRTMWPALLGVVKAIANWKIIVPFTIYFIYAATLVVMASRMGIWHKTLFIDTFLIIVFVGIPMFMAADRAKGANSLIKGTVRDALEPVALLLFYIGLEPFTLLGELILQPIIALLVMLSVVANNPKQRSVKRFFDGALGIIGIWLILHTTAAIASTWTGKEAHKSLEELLLSVLLPLSLLPVIYIFALLLRYESLALSLPSFINRKKIPRYVWFAIALRLNVNLRLLNNFTGRWRAELLETKNFCEAVAYLKEFQKAVRQRDQRLREYNKHVRKMTGVNGVDKNGLQFDRREFGESKTDLNVLRNMQMAQFKNRFHHYNPDFPIEVALSRLQKENHGVHMSVRRDKYAWYAWRQMPNGYYFGVGGTKHIEDIWLYDGTERPDSYPSNNAKGWLKSINGSRSAEWDHDDEPPAGLIAPEQDKTD